MKTVLIVECGCGNRREIKPLEIADNDYPMCDKCFMPMFPVKVVTTDKKDGE